MHRRCTLPVREVVHDVYLRVPPLWATQNTAHEPVSPYTLITHDSYTRDTTDSILTPSGALKKVDARDNSLDSKGKQALKQAAGSRCVYACQYVVDCIVLVLTHSPPSQNRTTTITCRYMSAHTITGRTVHVVKEAVVVRTTLHTAAPPTRSARVSTRL